MELAVVCDYLEENWTSMDLVADMLVEHASRLPDVSVRRVRPKRRLRVARRAATPSRLDRMFGRLVEYPLTLAASGRQGSVFHVADHSYAHLALLLPRERTGVYCHDADAFRALREPRASAVRRALARLLLDATKRAAVVFHSTTAVREELIADFGIPDSRLVAAPYGVPLEFSPTAQPSDVETRSDSRYLLHVGSLVPRKNPRFLLQLVAECRRAFPDVELVQVGGVWDHAHERLLDQLELRACVRRFRGISRSELAALYRGATAVLVPSRAEGFGLPLIEALACGALVVASDLPVLREVAGEAAILQPVSDLEAWSDVLRRVLGGNLVGPHFDARLARASLYSWDQHARTIVDTYRRLTHTAARLR